MDWESKGPGGKTLGKWHMSYSTKVTLVLMAIFIGLFVGGVYLYFHPSSPAGTVKALSKNKPIVDGWVDIGPTGVSVTAVAVSLSNDYVVYAGNSTDLFRSSDKGYSWTRLDFGPYRESSGFGNFQNIWASPTDPNFVYVMTTHDILKTIDGGRSWSVIFSRSKAGGVGDSSIAIDPSNPDIMYRAGYEGISKTTDGGYTWIESGDGRRYVSGVAIDPENPSVVYAGSMRMTGVSSDINFFKSIDGGASWNGIGGFYATPVIDSKYVYANPGFGILYSSDGGITWQMSPYVDESTGTRMTISELRASSVGGKVYGLINTLWTSGFRGNVYGYSVDDRKWAQLGDFQGNILTSLAVGSSAIYVGTEFGVFVHDIR